jgi:hypothetical protein
MQMARRRTDDRRYRGARYAAEPPRDAAVEAVLEALAPACEAGAPAWADVLERAAALRSRTRREGNVDDA